MKLVRNPYDRSYRLSSDELKNLIAERNILEDELKKEKSIIKRMKINKKIVEIDNKLINGCMKFF